MASKGTQVDDHNSLVLQETMEDIKKGLRELADQNDHVCVGLDQRYSGLQASKGKLQRLFQSLDGLLESMSELQDKVDSNERQVVFIDRECKDLETEKENLEYEEKFLATEESYQCLGNRVSQGEVEMTKNDLEAERNLRDFTGEDLHSKRAALDQLRKRLADKREEVEEEWNGFKEDVARHRENQRPYLSDVEQLNQTTIKRLSSLAKYSGNELSESERTAIRDTVRLLEAEMEYRTERNKLLDCQIRSCDLENEIDRQQQHRDALWKREAELQAHIQKLNTELQGNECTGILLKRSVKHENLPERDEGQDELDEPTSDSIFDNMEAERMQYFGRTLHRCSKHTDINLHQELEQEEDTMESLWVSTHFDAAIGSLKNRDEGPDVAPEGPGDDGSFPEPELESPGPDDENPGPDEDPGDDPGPDDGPDGPPDEPDDDLDEDDDDDEPDEDEGGPSNDDVGPRSLHHRSQRNQGGTTEGNISQDQQLSMVSKLRGRLNALGSSTTRLPTVNLHGGVVASGLDRQSSFRGAQPDSGRRRRR